MGETFIPRIRVGIAKIVVAILVFAGSVLLARQRDADRPQSAPQYGTGQLMLTVATFGLALSMLCPHQNFIAEISV
jgi:drug/metabolite transporter (DMT)-like permease